MRRSEELNWPTRPRVSFSNDAKTILQRGTVKALFYTHTHTHTRTHTHIYIYRNCCACTDEREREREIYIYTYTHIDITGIDACLYTSAYKSTHVLPCFLLHVLASKSCEVEYIQFHTNYQKDCFDAFCVHIWVSSRVHCKTKSTQLGFCQLMEAPRDFVQDSA